MSKEKQMFEDLVEIFDEEYEKRRLITPQNTAEKMTAKGYVKQSEGEWGFDGMSWTCSECGEYAPIDKHRNTIKSKFCPNCGAKMKGGAE